MAETGTQINWSGTGTADAVAAARLAMQGKAARRLPLPRTGATTSGDRSKTSVVPAARDGAAGRIRLKTFRAFGAAAGVPSLYALATLAILGAGLSGVWKANVAYAPEMYAQDGMVPAAVANAEGKNYAVFDLNLNIRRWREEQVARFTQTPDVVLLGASHWQEAHAGLVRSETMFNGHIHRDYWEDILGVVEVYVRNKRMPKRIILSIRDNQFTPVEQRKDFLWEPGIPNYRHMADRLGIAKQDAWKTYPWQRMKERFSLAMLFNNVTRWYNASERPHASSDLHFDKLDTLRPDGSILWSAQHTALFTPERAKKESLDFAAKRINSPPSIDPQGVDALDKLLTFIKANGTDVVLVHPPFNPIYFDAVQGGTYMSGLEKVREVTRTLAKKHGLHIIGDFDPAKVGCTADQYIDGEHGNPACLQKIFDQYEALLPQLKLETKKDQS